jgi:probable rRNA maturation factor
VAIEIRVHKKFRGAARVNRARLKRVAQRAFQAEKARGDAAIYVTTDSEIRLLNRKFHKTNAATDVLSFPSNDLGYLGDIIISYDRARVQARAAHWSIAEELDLLTVHGILHLVGYDDLTPRARKRMWEKQAKILGRKIN